MCVLWPLRVGAGREGRTRRTCCCGTHTQARVNVQSHAGGGAVAVGAGSVHW